MKKRQTQENLVTRLKHVIQHFKQILCASLLPYKPLVINARSPPFPTILGWENTEMPGATWVLTWLRFQTHPPCIGKRPDLASTCWHFACPQAGTAEITLKIFMKSSLLQKTRVVFHHPSQTNMTRKNNPQPPGPLVFVGSAVSIFHSFTNLASPTSFPSLSHWVGHW